MPTVPFIDPATGDVLVVDGDSLRSASSHERRYPIVDGIPRFVQDEGNYAASFGWQWNRWDLLSDGRDGRSNKLNMILERTNFSHDDLEGRSLLECGCGRGDDTEVLLQLPLAEVHAFDLSNAVNQLVEASTDDRLTVCQASIFDIPYPDASFDIVYCHRVLQHTPDPERALRTICKQVRPGGLLFAHSYKRSFRYLNKYKYKYRPVTRRMKPQTVRRLLDRHGERLYALHERVSDKRRVLDALLHSFVPFERIDQYGDFERSEMIELAKLVTFDALTPRYDRPMSSKTFRGILTEEGFEIRTIHDPKVSPIYATAIKVK